MKINARDIENILPKHLRRTCQIGICNPLYLERKKPVFCRNPVEYGGSRWSAKPSDVLPSVKSIIVLVNFIPVSGDYSVKDIILLVADLLWKRLSIKTHLLDKFGKPDRRNIIGGECSFLKSTGYNALKKMILFKDAAYYAGLGQYGRNSLIINHRFGSDLKIQALFTEAELKYDSPILPKAYPGCKWCDICIKACPVKIIHDYKVISQTDACLYVNKNEYIITGKVPKNARAWSNVLAEGKMAASCRICQSFCPVNAQHYQNRFILSRRKKISIISYKSTGLKTG